MVELEEMLGGVLPLTKEKRDKTLVPLESYVEKKRDGVTVMVVCNEKNHKYREKLEITGAASTISAGSDGCQPKGTLMNLFSKEHDEEI